MIEDAAGATLPAVSIGDVTVAAGRMAEKAPAVAVKTICATGVVEFIAFSVGATMGAAAKNDALPTVKLPPSAKSEGFAIVSVPDATVVAAMPLLPGPLMMTLPGPETESEWPLPLTEPEIVRTPPATTEIATLLSRPSGALIVWAAAAATVTVAVAAALPR